MKPIRILLCLLLAAACLACQPSAALAAEVTVVAEPGVSDILAGEFRSITAKSMQFYQEVYAFAPTKPVKLIVVADEAGYLQVLQREGIAYDQAVRLAKATGGVSLGNRPVVVICTDKTTNYLSRIRTITHEMFHQMQSELRGNLPAHNWLTEGSAKISEYVLLEWLNEGSLASRRQSLLNVLANAKLKADPADLTESGAKWTSLIEQKMYPYETAELMTDYLMTLAGKPPILKYFAYLRDTGSRDAAFSKAFGMTHQEFVQKFKTYIAQENSTVGQAKFENEGVAADILQRITADGQTIGGKLRAQGWTQSVSLRFILVPNQEGMLKVLRREQPQIEEAKHVQLSQRATIAGIGGPNYVFDTGKAADPAKSFTDLAVIMSRNAIAFTARPAPVTGYYWLYEGGVRLLAARMADEAGLRPIADSRQAWIASLKKGKGLPTLAEMNLSLPNAAAKYGADAVIAAACLAADYLTGGGGSLVNYFIVLRDLNDAPRSFQQAFGKTHDAFDGELATYLRGLLQ